MNKDFSFFTISIFDKVDFDAVVGAISQIEEKEIESSVITLSPEVSHIESYFNPPPGGAHFPQFCVWENHNYPQKVFFISNYEDGLSSLCNVIHTSIRGNLIMCSISNESRQESPFYHFHYSDSHLETRDIIAYKEDKWIYYETGKPLDIENTDYYKSKIIRKRLNTAIIEEYLRKLGINIWDIDSKIDRSITYVQHAWH